MSRAAVEDLGAPKAPLSVRQRIEDEIEWLIGALDAMDGDENLEPGDEGEPDEWDYEPTLGWGHGQRPLAEGWSYDCTGTQGDGDM